MTMAAASHRLTAPRKILVKDLNDYLTCNLCGGYFVDATAVIDCSHTFCRACIVRHFESSRFCPNCGSLVHKSKPLSKLRSDATLQSLIYKTIPALYTKELQRRADFYHSTGFRANSSCSDDSVLGDSEEWANSNIGDPTLYFSPDDSVSLSVEYYQPQPGESIAVKNSFSHAMNCNAFVKSDTDVTTRITSTSGIIDNSDVAKKKTDAFLNTDKSGSVQLDSKAKDCTASDIKESTVNAVADLTIDNVTTKESTSDISSKEDDKKAVGHKRFLQCPAAVKMVHLMKFLRMKFALSNEHRVDIIYAGEVLPPYLSLMDVAYTFKWNRAKPMRFFYLIYTPVKLPALDLPPPTVLVKEVPKLLELPPPTARKPSPILIKIEPIKSDLTPETALTKPTTNPPTPNNLPLIKPNELKKENNNNGKVPQKSVKFVDEPPQSAPNNNTKLNESVSSQPAATAAHSKSKTIDGTIENCVYDYTEPDKDEIKAFAERRDREWALQKHADTLTHISKKRKKNKHAKNEFIHKKRKLHAEITSNDNPSKTDDSLKLKVKLSVPNGHKHKHRNNPTSSVVAKLELPKPQELSPKERLLQMRQVRHKNIVAAVPDEKAKSAIPEVANKPPSSTDVAEPIAKLEVDRTPELLSSSKTLRSDFTFKTAISKDICSKYVRINLEKCPDGKPSLAKKPSLNNLAVKANEKVDKPNTANKASELKLSVAKLPEQSKNPGNEDKSIKSIAANIDKEIETKPTAIIIDESKSIENKLNNIDFKSVHQSATLITKNFTVSKVEQGVKRKLEPLETSADKRPSLEITVINVVSLPGPISTAQSSGIQTKPISNNTQTKTTTVTSITKPTASEGAPLKKIRPPPLTIPLGRIKEMNLKSNAMAARAAEKCDIFGALDLSAKPNKEIAKPEFRSSASPKLLKPVEHQLRLTASPRPKPDQTRSTASPKPKPCVDQTRPAASPRPKSDQIRLKAPLKIDLKEPAKPGEKKPNISNLQLLSESAVQIREMMVKNSTTTPIPIPNLIKKIPNSHISQNASLKAAASGLGAKFITKPPHLIPKTPTSIIGAKAPNFIPKGPNFLPKNLQKLPKLNEINKTQFARLNSNAQQIRSTRPAGQNQSIRNIPNPSLLVRQQNQNRINSMANAASGSNGLEVVKDGAKLNIIKPQLSCTEKHDTEKKPTDTKASEPPPLKPIEGYKK